MNKSRVIEEAIGVKNSEELEKVLLKMETQGFRWLSGNKATAFTPEYKFPYLIYKWNDGTITYGEEYGDAIKMSAEAFLGEEFLGHEAITKDDILKAAATVMAKDETTRELIKAQPMMFVVLGLFAAKIADELLGEKKGNIHEVRELFKD